MNHSSPILFTLLFEQTDWNAFTGCIEEMPELIHVEGNTYKQVRQALYDQLSPLTVSLPRPENIRVQTKVRLRLTYAATGS